MKKLLLSIFTCFGLIVLVGSQETKAEVNGVIPEEIQMTDAEKAKGEKVNAIIKEMNEHKDEPWTVKWVRLAVPYYKQLNRWYCGPATTAQTIRFYNKKAQLTQTTLGKELGTTTNGTVFSNIKTVLNKRSFITDKYGFYNVTKKSKELIGGWIGYSVQIDKPVVLNIGIKTKNTKTIEYFGYTTDGHYMNASGVYGEVSRVGIGNVTKVATVDPYGEYGAQKSKKGKIDTTIGVIKTIIDNQPAATKNILW